jgi:hypothetical protein
VRTHTLTPLFWGWSPKPWPEHRLDCVKNLSIYRIRAAGEPQYLTYRANPRGRLSDVSATSQNVCCMPRWQTSQHQCRPVTTSLARPFVTTRLRHAARSPHGAETDGLVIRGAATPPAAQRLTRSAHHKHHKVGQAGGGNRRRRHRSVGSSAEIRTCQPRSVYSIADPPMGRGGNPNTQLNDSCNEC